MTERWPFLRLCSAIAQYRRVNLRVSTKRSDVRGLTRLLTKLFRTTARGQKFYQHEATIRVYFPWSTIPLATIPLATIAYPIAQILIVCLDTKISKYKNQKHLDHFLNSKTVHRFTNSKRTGIESIGLFRIGYSLDFVTVPALLKSQ